jgi:hypothetical protein
LPAAASSDPAVEVAFWNSIEDAKNPEMYRVYLQQFPAGKFVQLADLKVLELTSASASAESLIEFVNEEIEKLQRDIARKHNYELIDHNQVLYVKPLPKKIKS